MSRLETIADRWDLRRVAHAIGLLFLVVIVFVFVAASLPAIVGADESYVVRSDSMSPTIKAGSVVFVNEVSPSDVNAGDVITFETGTGPESVRVTHRVVKVFEEGNSREFRTKGDANENPDPNLVTSNEVVGKVSFHLPLMGYVANFAGSDIGILTLVVLPAVALALLEIRDIIREDVTGGDDR